MRSGRCWRRPCPRPVPLPAAEQAVQRLVRQARTDAAGLITWDVSVDSTIARSPCAVLESPVSASRPAASGGTGRTPTPAAGAGGCGVADHLGCVRSLHERAGAVRYDATVHIAAVKEWLLPSPLNRP